VCQLFALHEEIKLNVAPLLSACSSASVIWVRVDNFYMICESNTKLVNYS